MRANLVLDLLNRIIENRIEIWDEITFNIEDSETRWPTSVYFGEEGQMKFFYTRQAEPNYKIKSARYRCRAIVHTSVLLDLKSEKLRVLISTF